MPEYKMIDLSESKKFDARTSFETDTFKIGLVLLTEQGTLNVRLSAEQLEEVKKCLGTELGYSDPRRKVY